MTSSQRWSGLRSRLWSVLDRAATVAVLVAAVAFFWNGGLRSAPSGGAPADRQTIPIPEDPVALDGTQMMGSPTARVVLMEFSDFQCPYCGRFAQETLPGLRAKYVDAGLVQFVFRHNPLPVHPNAQAAAEAAICAARQGNFWGMHDQLFRDPAKLEESHVV